MTWCTAKHSSYEKRADEDAHLYVLLVEMNEKGEQRRGDTAPCRWLKSLGTFLTQADLGASESSHFANVAQRGEDDIVRVSLCLQSRLLPFIAKSPPLLHLSFLSSPQCNSSLPITCSFSRPVTRPRQLCQRQVLNTRRIRRSLVV